MHTRFTPIVVFFICCCFISYHASAQTVLLSVDRQTDSVRTERGPNLKKFSHAFINFGFVAGADKPGARIVYGSSVEYGFGVRKKYKVSPVYSPGWEIGLNGKIFKLRQKAGKVLPDTILNDAERMDYGSLYISFFNRINFDPDRGNFMGAFLDIGIRGGWDYQATHVIKNTLPGGSKINSQITGLSYVTDMSCDVFARIGYSHLSLYASYRLSKFFKPSYAFPELPALTAGLELGIFRQ